MSDTNFVGKVRSRSEIQAVAGLKEPNVLSEHKSPGVSGDISFIPKFAAEICQALKNTAVYRMRIQKEIEDQLKKQSFRAFGHSSLQEWPEIKKRG